MTRIKRYILFILAIFIVAFPSPAAYASDAAIEAPETVHEEASAGTETTQIEPTQPAVPEKAAAEAPIKPLVQPTEQPKIVVQPQSTPLPASPIMITGYQVADGKVQFFQLYNSSSSMMALDGWKLEYRAASGNNEIVGTIDLHAYLLPHQYAVFSQIGFLENSDSVYDVVIGSGFNIDRLQIIPPDTYANNEVASSTFSPGMRYELSKSDAGNYTSKSVFEVITDNPPLIAKGLYSYSDNTPLRVVEILANAKNCSPLDTGVECHDYVKLYNPSDEPADISGYRMRLGYGNQTPGISNAIKLNGTVEPRQYKVVDRRDDGAFLDITASGGNVWLEDTYGLKTYTSTVQTYEDIGLAVHKGHSWALDETDQTWKWGVPSPNGSNNFDFSEDTGGEAVNEDGFTPCRPDQERNPETNRCRLIASSNLTPCAANQYRSEETNRCRNIASTVSTLTPCAPNQVRSSETNRCRSIASDASTLAPCKENQERNPETNRCRNKAGSDVPEAVFAVQPVKDSGKAFVGWWALGGVGALAVGYGAWEWRREMRAGIRKVATFFTSRK